MLFGVGLGRVDLRKMGVPYLTHISMNCVLVLGTFGLYVYVLCWRTINKVYQGLSLPVIELSCLIWFAIKSYTTLGKGMWLLDSSSSNQKVICRRISCRKN